MRHQRTGGYRLGFWRAVFIVLVATGLVATGMRFASGLGPVSHLSDAYPWGIWKIFNVLVAVAVGGAGFTLMGLVYVFHAERFRPIVRPTVLLAFLCYASAAFTLTIDIGRPWTIWHPIVMWNSSSVLFEVAWCLMLYSIVLVLEGSGMLFEKLGWPRLVRLQHAISLPVVIVGVVLSTLHQSSLGSLFLIVPGKLHPLWYTKSLPLLFLFSAVAAGLSMLIIFSRISERAFRRRLEPALLADLGRILVAVVGVYGITRFFDLWNDGALVHAFKATSEAGLFWVEILLGVVIPFFLLASPRTRASANGLYAGALAAVLGVTANRLNVGITGFESAMGGSYFPSWQEVAITLMVAALVAGAFRTAVRYLPVFPSSEHRPGRGSDRFVVLRSREPAERVRAG